MKEKKFKKIYIEITNICNLSCTFCEQDNRKKEMMQLKDFEKVINDVKKHTNHIYLHVKGEPLLHPNINEFIDLAYKNKLKLNITTNGLLIDNLKSKNIRQINYSMQSSHDIDEIKETISKIQEYIKGSNISFVIRMWRDETKENQILQKMIKEKFQFEGEIKDRKQVGNNIYLSIKPEFNWPNLKKDICSTEGYCHALSQQIAILVDGTVVPCCLDNNGDIKLGNIFKENIDKILNKERAIRMRRGFENRKIEEELCKRCDFRKTFK
ncbi:MAG: SPASM domain-containing protein [Clostridia bacterium]|nr:SPASM domain-containing protein [Clostridia bacterium]MDD4375987.1 SPASM domain-containing protein [Clostridia bacterium]